MAVNHAITRSEKNKKVVGILKMPHMGYMKGLLMQDNLKSFRKGDLIAITR